MFAQEFEKVAAKGKSEVFQAVKGIGKSALEAGKGVVEGAQFHGKRSAEKIKQELPDLKRKWKGLKHPESYKALASTATKFIPEGIAGYAGYKGIKYTFDPNSRQSATLGYY